MSFGCFNMFKGLFFSLFQFHLPSPGHFLASLSPPITWGARVLCGTRPSAGEAYLYHGTNPSSAARFRFRKSGRVEHGTSIHFPLVLGKGSGFHVGMVLKCVSVDVLGSRTPTWNCAYSKGPRLRSLEPLKGHVEIRRDTKSHFEGPFSCGFS